METSPTTTRERIRRTIMAWSAEERAAAREILQRMEVEARMSPAQLAGVIPAIR